MNVIKSLMRDCPDFFDYRLRPNKQLPFFGRFATRKLDTPGRGRVYGKPLSPWSAFWNGNTYTGLNYVLNTGFRGTAASSSWFCGLINTGGVVSVNDTSASHPGWTEITAYASATRPAWSPSAASLGLLTISSAITFTANATIDVLGAFIANSSAKSSVVDTIYSTAVNGVAQNFLNTQQVQVFYTAGIDPAA